MNIIITETRPQAGVNAAREGANHIREAIRQHGAAQIVLATGASQLDMFAELVKITDIDWTKVTGFQIDEYAGIPIMAPGSLRQLLRERFLDVLPQPIRAFYSIGEDEDLHRECSRLAALINERPIDVTFVGIGVNGQIGFNSPPADFATDEAYIVVDLSDVFRRQLFKDGGFETLKDVPTKAISMSIAQLIKSKHIVCTVADRHMALAVRKAVEGPVTVAVPASILQEHDAVTVCLDTEAASLLTTQTHPTFQSSRQALAALASGLYGIRR